MIWNRKPSIYSTWKHKSWMIQQTHLRVSGQSDLLFHAEDVYKNLPLNPFKTTLRCNLHESQFRERGFLADRVLQWALGTCLRLIPFFSQQEGLNWCSILENTHFPLIHSQMYDTILAFSMQAMMSTAWLLCAKLVNLDRQRKARDTSTMLHLTQKVNYDVGRIRTVKFQLIQAISYLCPHT